MKSFVRFLYYHFFWLTLLIILFQLSRSADGAFWQYSVPYLIIFDLLLMIHNLSTPQLKKSLAKPANWLIASLLLYTIMPVIALGLIKLLQPPLIGKWLLLMISISPSSHLSPFYSYLSRANLPLTLLWCCLSLFIAFYNASWTLPLLNTSFTQFNSLNIKISYIQLAYFTVFIAALIILPRLNKRLVKKTPLLSLLTIAILLLNILSLIPQLSVTAWHFLSFGKVLASLLLYYCLTLITASLIAHACRLNYSSRRAIVLSMLIHEPLWFTQLPHTLFTVLWPLLLYTLMIENLLAASITSYWMKSRLPIIMFSQWLTPKGFNAITIYPFIICRDKKIATKELINHEKIHIQQQKELGLIGFYLLYLLHYTFNLFRYKNSFLAYRRIVFEQEAYQNENNLTYLKKRKIWSFLRYFR
jgi:hypothetical protein